MAQPRHLIRSARVLHSSSSIQIEPRSRYGNSTQIRSDDDVPASIKSYDYRRLGLRREEVNEAIKTLQEGFPLQQFNAA